MGADVSEKAALKGKMSKLFFFFFGNPLRFEPDKNRMDSHERNRDKLFYLKDLPHSQWERPMGFHSKERLGPLILEKK